jgi:peptidoglycan-associated lipoprotein
MRDFVNWSKFIDLLKKRGFETSCPTGDLRMFSSLMSRRSMKLGVALTIALSLGACARNNADGAGGAGGPGSGFGAGGAAVPGSQQDFVVNVGDRVFFESDSSELSSTAIGTLEKQASWLGKYPRYSFTVEGHADERGTREYNFALGARRAEAVKSYLAAKGVSASRIRTISYGKERPVAVCDNISCWSQNRRAVTILNGGNS